MDEPTITCPRCEGGGYDPGLSAPNDEYPCVTCDGTGRVHEYVSAMASCGGVSVEVRVVGHRQAPVGFAVEDWPTPDLSPTLTAAIKTFRELVPNPTSEETHAA